VRTGYGYDKCAACYMDREGPKSIMGVMLAETIAEGERVKMEEVVVNTLLKSWTLIRHPRSTQHP
jgi:hypothetical protein